MSVTITGTVREKENQKGLPNLKVEAFDADFLKDDLIGRTTTGDDGTFSIRWTAAEGPAFLRDKPDLYLIVKSQAGARLKSTRQDTLRDAVGDVEINVDISHSTLVGASIVHDEAGHWMTGIDPESLKKYSTWTLRPDHDPNDKLLGEIQSDMQGRDSILDLLKTYWDELNINTDNNAPQIQKLAKLFEVGQDLDDLEGHHYGIPIGLRTGDQEGALSEYGNLIGLLWGVSLQDECPWVGKSFSAMTAAQANQSTLGLDRPDGKVYRGINHFNRIDHQPLNIVSYYFMNWWMGLGAAPKKEQKNYGYEKNGGHFLAYKNRSVYPGSDRNVFQLNYRFKHLGNNVPLTWLIDELVQVADGLYLGQLLFATKRILRGYDPAGPNSDHHYQHFGYFLLWDRSWNAEARRLFSYLEIPVTAPGLVDPDVAASIKLPKFSTFTFEETPSAGCNDEIMATINDDMRDKPTIMHLLQEYSDQLQQNCDNDSPYFVKLQELFNRGIGIPEVRGFFRGALVSWHSAGLLKFFDVNVLNRAWSFLGRHFSTWTGKSFEDIPDNRLRDITDGKETGEIPTFWGANTQALRTSKEKFVGELMKVGGIWTEPATAEEAMTYGYDLKNFFFIAHQAKSINPTCKGKTIFNFNYRWPNLKTIKPDRYCIDELVAIADGLYLGHLMYATEVHKPFDPAADPGVYKYRLFGYFLLMDEEGIRLG
ncbi:MAG: carboxypeptidase-like regulatory domain-containing protein [candidate division Zixibacteria bacterium]|nr:carboxypeptidase-like regulatory domain-containing protein [candidate division Zixibacteria bacterium]